MDGSNFSIRPNRRKDRLIISLDGMERKVSRDIDTGGFAVILRELCDEYLKKSGAGQKRKRSSEKDVDPMDT